MNLLYKFATRSRPQKFFSCLDNIVTQQNDKENYQIICSADIDDPTMHCDEVMSRAKRINNPRIHLHYGSSKNKIEAYNRDISLADPDWDILINMSDDMWFTQPGFDTVIREDMKKHFPDIDGFLHYSDGNQHANVCTLAIIGRKLVERISYEIYGLKEMVVYHPSYTSLFCDNEQTDLAKMLGKYVYMGDSKILFKHYHPAWGHGKMDDLYRRNEARELWLRDEKNYNERKKINFGVKTENHA